MLGSLHMAWRRVLFANWPVDPGVVRPHVPEALGVDRYDDRAWLSIVAIEAADVRPTWAPRAVGRRISAVNLRTYVTHGDNDGVYFFSLDARSVPGVVGGRLFHHLPYFYARIDRTATADSHRVESVRRTPGARPARFAASATTGEDSIATDPPSLAAFIVERYRYYTETMTGTLRYAGVDHDAWPLYETTLTVDENSLFRANQFATPAAEPICYYSPGVESIITRSFRVGRPSPADRSEGHPST